MFLHTLLLVLCLLPSENKKGTLMIEIKGIKDVYGDVHVGIYNRAEGFAEKNTVCVGKVVHVNSTTITVEIPDLPYGTYAISAYHDKNRNGQLAKSLLGVPTEIYGFSNNARGTFGPPAFNEACFQFNAAVSKISFGLR